MYATIKSLEQKFPGEGESRFAQIAELGLYGRVGGGEGDLDPGATLDLVGCLDADNKTVSNAAKEKIKQLAGITAETKKDSK